MEKNLIYALLGLFLFSLLFDPSLGILNNPSITGYTVLDEKVTSLEQKVKSLESELELAKKEVSDLENSIKKVESTKLDDLNTELNAKKQELEQARSNVLSKFWNWINGKVSDLEQELQDLTTQIDSAKQELQNKRSALEEKKNSVELKIENLKSELQKAKEDLENAKEEVELERIRKEQEDAAMGSDFLQSEPTTPERKRWETGGMLVPSELDTGMSWDKSPLFAQQQPMIDECLAKGGEWNPGRQACMKSKVQLQKEQARINRESSPEYVCAKAGGTWDGTRCLAPQNVLDQKCAEMKPGAMYDMQLGKCVLKLS